MAGVAWIAAALVLLPGTRAAANDAGARYYADEAEVVWMKRERPEAARDLFEGEALLRRAESPADIEKAAGLFRAASLAAKEATIPPRRQCQALTALGRREEAMNACDISLTRGTSALTMRAAVGAALAGSGAPTATEMGRVLLYTSNILQNQPNEPWGYAARCDLALKLRDTRMLVACAADLERVAPGHYETERARAALRAVRGEAGVTAGWFVIALSIVATLLHAAARIARRPARARASAVTAVLALFLVLAPRAALGAAEPEGEGEVRTRPAVAGHLSKYPISDSDPETSVPSAADRDRDPLEYGYFLMDLGDKADAAVRRGDHALAAKVYRAVVKAVPDAVAGYRKACEEYEAASDLANAKAYCAGALTVKDVVLADYSRYGRVVFADPSSIVPADVKNLDAVIAHLKTDPNGAAVAWDIECNLGVALSDSARLSECAPALAKIAPNDPKAIFFQWATALGKRDFQEAQLQLAHMRGVEQDPARVRSMEKATFEATPVWRRGFRDWRFGVATTLLLACGLTLLLLHRRRTVTRVSA